jgi:hypothetical protein
MRVYMTRDTQTDRQTDRLQNQTDLDALLELLNPVHGAFGRADEIELPERDRLD